MTPVAIMCILEMHCLAEPAFDGHNQPVAHQQLVRKGLIEEHGGYPFCPKEWKITEKGKAYVEFLRHLPVPEARWELPSDFPIQVAGS